jgi:hypothetical protein|tara:strand:- start:311 stop:613 length:303 start_codon:yes stop_codon:yes gene_type:complete
VVTVKDIVTLVEVTYADDSIIQFVNASDVPGEQLPVGTMSLTHGSRCGVLKKLVPVNVNDLPILPTAIVGTTEVTTGMKSTIEMVPPLFAYGPSLRPPVL